jgi:hypothetical protein
MRQQIVGMYWKQSLIRQGSSIQEVEEVNCEYSEDPEDIEDEDCEEEMDECNNRRSNAFEQQESIRFHEYLQGSHNDSVI